MSMLLVMAFALCIARHPTAAAFFIMLHWLFQYA